MKKMQETVTYSLGLLVFRDSFVRTVGELCVWPKLRDNVMADPKKKTFLSQLTLASMIGGGILCYGHKITLTNWCQTTWSSP